MEAETEKKNDKSLQVKLTLVAYPKNYLEGQHLNLCLRIFVSYLKNVTE